MPEEVRDAQYWLDAMRTLYPEGECPLRYVWITAEIASSGRVEWEVKAVFGALEGQYRKSSTLEGALERYYNALRKKLKKETK